MCTPIEYNIIISMILELYSAQMERLHVVLTAILYWMQTDLLNLAACASLCMCLVKDFKLVLSSFIYCMHGIIISCMHACIRNNYNYCLYTTEYAVPIG